MEFIIFLLAAFVIVFVIAYRNSAGQNIYLYVSKTAGNLYDKYAPYSFKEVRQKVKDLGINYICLNCSSNNSIFDLFKM